jgi:ribosomal protein S18 acetylase RimI-like enzyme
MNEMAMDLLKRRDLSNFVKIRTAFPGDDLNLGEMLVRTFRETYNRKLPNLITTDQREIELRDVHGRRRNGVVRVLELGFQIIGTYSLMAPQSALDDSWTPGTCTLRCVAVDPGFHSLRLSERLLEDALARARDWRAEAVCLHVQSGATGVAKLYERFGFRRDPRGDRISHGYEIEGYLLELQSERSFDPSAADS